MNLASTMVSFAASFALLMVAMSVHEFSHGFVAYKLGDTTAKHSGRLTLNPLAHIDPFWTLLLPLFLFISSQGHFIFGAAKPVPINYWALRNPRRDIIWVGAAGPAANLILAAVLSAVINFLPLPATINGILINLIVINVLLGIFNLMPIPPLDGSRILMGLLPQSLAVQYSRIEPFGFIVLLILMWLGLFQSIILPLVSFILRLSGIHY